jgi:hypothetical protein
MGFNVEAVVADAAAIDRAHQEALRQAESMVDVVSALAGDDKFKSLEGARATSRSTLTR